MILSRVRHAIFRLTARRRKLVLVCFDLPNKCWHFFNQFVGYRAAAEALGLTPIVLAPRTLDPDIAERLAARPVLDSIRKFNLDGPQATTNQLADFFDMVCGAQSFWLAIETENLSRQDIILFSASHPVLIQSTGLWLARRPPKQRPSIFIRFADSTLVDRRTGRMHDAAIFYRVASKDLCARPGQEHVFFLANCQGTARAVTRVCDRRTFLMPLPQHYGDLSTFPAPPDVPTVYLHFNFRSGQLAHGASEIIRRVRAVDSKVKFLVKFSHGCNAGAGTIDDDIASGVELVAAEQDVEDYHRNFVKSSIVVLAYEEEAGGTFTSGVFTEAAGFGRPVVVPPGSWSAEQLAASNGAGGVFERATSESVADAIIEVLRALPRLAPVAEKLAPQTGKKNSCPHVLELMLALEQEAPNMEPRYRVGEHIDFSDAYDSRCFMRGGWAATEPWGVWTEGDLAELVLWPDAVPDGPLILRANVNPFLAGAHDRLSVRVLCCGQEIAEWGFERGASGEECRLAEIPPRHGSDRDQPLEITFAIDAPRSPHELGLSEDTRSLGLGFVKLSISSAEEKSAECDLKQSSKTMR